MGNVYQQVTNKIIKYIEDNNCLPWERPWACISPKNHITGKPYRGINFLLTVTADFEHQSWVTFNQCRSLGGKIKKGASSTPIIFWSRKEKEEDGDDQSYSFLKKYNIFNIEQTEGLDIPKEDLVKLNEFESIEVLDRVIEGYQNPPSISHELLGMASYDPVLDRVEMPWKENFKSTMGYYATIMHELAHSTGHKSRLSRKGITEPIKFNSIPYSKEEVIAELTGAFLTSNLGVSLEREIRRSADYIQGYLSALNNDPKFIVQATAHAQKAADYILGIKSEFRNLSNQAIA